MLCKGCNETTFAEMVANFVGLKSYVVLRAWNLSISTMDKWCIGYTIADCLLNWTYLEKCAVNSFMNLFFFLPRIRHLTAWNSKSWLFIKHLNVNKSKAILLSKATLLIFVILLCFTILIDIATLKIKLIKCWSNWEKKMRPNPASTPNVWDVTWNVD